MQGHGLTVFQGVQIERFLVGLVVVLWVAAAKVLLSPVLPDHDRSRPDRIALPGLSRSPLRVTPIRPRPPPRLAPSASPP